MRRREESVTLTNVGRLLERRGKEFLGSAYKDPITSFADFQKISVSNPEVYWKTVLDEMNISFSKPPECILRDNPNEDGSSSYPSGQWLPGASINPAQNCLNLNGTRSLNDTVIIWRDELQDDLPLQRMTLEELRQEILSVKARYAQPDSTYSLSMVNMIDFCWLVAYALESLGLEKGSAIAIDMPMNCKSVVIYLAIVLAGYVVVSIADSFAAREISTRLKISNAKVIFTQCTASGTRDWVTLQWAGPCFMEPTVRTQYEKVSPNRQLTNDLPKPHYVGSAQDGYNGLRGESKDLILRGDKALPLYSRVVDAESPMAIVIPSRSPGFSMKLRNGDPKAIPWTNITPLKAAADAWCHLDIRKGDIVSWPTNLGWMMGPWLVYASLLNGASMALYNGSPLGPGFAKFVQTFLSLYILPRSQHKEGARGCNAGSPMLPQLSLVRSWRNANSTSGYDWSAIRCFASTGEASNVDEYLWLMGRARYKPIIEYCGGTEIGGGFITGSLQQAQSLAAFSTPAMCCNLFILGEDGHPTPENVPGIGELALGSLMLGASNTLLNADHYGVYFKGMPLWNGKVLRRHGDVFERTARGFYHAHGRADDTMNLGGIKVSSVEIERICNGVDSNIVETAAIGIPPSGGGPEQLAVAVVLKNSNITPQDLLKLRMSFNSALQKTLNPLFRVSQAVPVPSLPRTASNKVMRRVLRQQLAEHNQSSKI
ncbi:putative acyl-activating enzyme peroxisomal-like [Trifolium pratense]|uniref:Putative acyl-activating enzyme peroxisomal-like n=1 Tax=Trifolium pratense TaxID=57577 RepID=A0A2K3NPK9_TRIPR|nr:putative acyl-activating enzyme peroxisomal-like [Trifolium pratense]